VEAERTRTRDSVGATRDGRYVAATATLISQANSYEMPTEEEAEASAQADLYEIVCAYIERMSDETRRKTFAHTDSGAAAIERPPVAGVAAIERARTTPLWTACSCEGRAGAAGAVRLITNM
jgi:hypothetical protein